MYQSQQAIVALLFLAEGSTYYLDGTTRSSIDNWSLLFGNNSWPTSKRLYRHPRDWTKNDLHICCPTVICHVLIYTKIITTTRLLKNNNNIIPMIWLPGHLSDEEVLQRERNSGATTHFDRPEFFFGLPKS